MSSTDPTVPISPTRFAAALKDLSLPLLHLKVLELRNSIAHLDYSNEQLRPFAEGTQSVLSSATSPDQQPDQDCIEAIAENEAVIARMEERIRLVRQEVEERGCSWTEFQSREEVEEEEKRRGEGLEGLGMVNGDIEETNGVSRHSAWTDGTFQTGTIRNGEVVVDSNSGQGVAPREAGTSRGGSLSDEELRRRMEEQMRNLGNEDDNDEGMHL